MAALLLIVASAVFDAQQVAADGATPPGHLQGAAVSETAARLQWMAGTGNLWYCLDVAATSDDLTDLTGTWFNSGCGMTGTSHLVKGLQCSSTYYARVFAWTADGGMYSPPLRVDMTECATMITAPVNLKPLFSTAHSVRLAWDAGANNNWYCVEMAEDPSEVMTYGPTWRSYGCGNTDMELTLGGLSCETIYYWRVVTWNYSVDTASDVRIVITGDCDGRLRRAPVRSVEIDKVGEDYRVEVVIELPNGCHSPGSYSVERDGSKIEILVRNTYIPPSTACADIVGSHRWTIDLGKDLLEGQTYEVVVNDGASAFFRFEPPVEAY